MRGKEFHSNLLSHSHTNSYQALTYYFLSGIELGRESSRTHARVSSPLRIFVAANVSPCNLCHDGAHITSDFAYFFLETVSMRIDIPTSPLRPLVSPMPSAPLLEEPRGSSKVVSEVEKPATIVHLSATDTAKEVQTYTRQMVRPTTALAPTTAVADVSKPEPSSVFSPGKDVEGVYRNGKFKTEDGQIGEYFPLNNGKIGFTIDGFHGILTGNKALAYNPETKEFYSMYIEYGDGKFKITDVQPGRVEVPPTGERKPIFTEGEHRGVRVARTDSGQVKIGIYQSETGQWLEGRGVLNPDGTYLIGFENGTHFTGHYGFDENGKLLIFDREATDSRS